MNSNPVFSLYVPTKILFGCGEIKKLATETLPGRKAMIVISGGTSMKKYGYLDKVLGYLTENDVSAIVYDKILPNPIKTHVMEAAAICREQKCDFIIGLGGGSSIDSAKAIAVMACNDGDYWNYVNGGTGKGRPVTKALPIVAIPTTAGTGTEADPWTVITNEEKQEKIGFGCPLTFPVLSIVDPTLMVTIPPHLTAYQGFDAFFHLAEGYVHPMATELSRNLSLYGMGLIKDYLPKVYRNPSDRKARRMVALASLVGGMVECYSSCTFEHTLEHAISSLYHDVIHGAGLIAISEAYFNRLATSKKVNAELIEMARVFDPKARSAFSFANELHKLKVKCHVDKIDLKSFNIPEKDIVRIAKKAQSLVGNTGKDFSDPISYSYRDIVNILEDAYQAKHD